VTAAELAARAEIQEVIVRYAHAIDTRDFDAVAACFAREAEATYGGVRAPPGRDAIAAWLEENLTALASTHLLGTPLIELEGEHAQAVTPAIAVLLERSGEAAVLRTRGLRYSDVLEHGDEGWRIIRRVHEALWEAQQPALGSPVPPRPPAE
jgi:uncharacterized protein (TIGR02246 family)